jgi:dihydrodipicolinate synthase/N-acetylneuraminate lyase
VAALVHDRSDAACARVTDLRRSLASVPIHAALKAVLVRRRVLSNDDVRAPLRSLTDAERAIVLAL